MRLNHLYGLTIGFLVGSLIMIFSVKSVQAGCNQNCWSRSCAKSYAYTAVYEPYSVTHAEWIDDDQRTWTGEGIDCSGVVHKAWGMKDAQGSTEFYFWKTHETLPEKYSAAGFYSNCSSTNACVKVCDGGNCSYASTAIMDVFATLNEINNPDDNHVGLIYQELTNGQDQILEAVNQAGTYQDVRIIVQTWRMQSKYRGLKRAVWSSSCSPCPSECTEVYLPLVNKPWNPEKGLGDPYPLPLFEIENAYP